MFCSCDEVFDNHVWTNLHIIYVAKLRCEAYCLNVAYYVDYKELMSKQDIELTRSATICQVYASVAY